MARATTTAARASQRERGRGGARTMRRKGRAMSALRCGGRRRGPAVLPRGPDAVGALRRRRSGTLTRHGGGGGRARRRRRRRGHHGGGRGRLGAVAGVRRGGGRGGGRR